MSSSEAEQEKTKKPDFARRAGDLLQAGQVQEALDACIEGTAQFPWYGTGALMLGRCYDTLGRVVEAMLAYRRALKALPDNSMLRDLLQSAEEREQHAFEAYAESQDRVLKAKKESQTFESYVSDGAGQKESTVEFLLRQLQGAKRIAPPAPELHAVEDAATVPEGPPARIVTATLAEIYANQGQYREAIKSYRILLDQRPEDAPRYEKRLADLEELAKMQKAER